MMGFPFFSKGISENRVYSVNNNIHVGEAKIYLLDLIQTTEQAIFIFANKKFIRRSYLKNHNNQEGAPHEIG